MWQCYFSPSEKRFYRPLLKNCIQNQYTNDVTLPSAPRYFHPSEIDILSNNPLEKLVLPPLEKLSSNAFRKCHLYGVGGDVPNMFDPFSCRASYETCWLLCGTSFLTNFREFVPFFQPSSNKVTHQMQLFGLSARKEAENDLTICTK